MSAPMAEWMRAVWVESERREFPSLLALLAWTNALRRLREEGHLTRWGALFDSIP